MLFFNLLYKKPIIMLAIILYDLNKARFFLKTILKNLNRLQFTIINIIYKIYTKVQIIKNII